jgi:pimeloyl-ACP methyl ester carboxylesterase
VARQWAAYARERPLRRHNVLRQLAAARRYRLRGGVPENPLLVLGAAQDRLVDPDCAIRVARHCAAPLRMHPLAGHDLPLDDPAWIVETIAEWREQPVGSEAPADATEAPAAR